MATTRKLHQTTKLLVLIDPKLLRAARQIYREYCAARPDIIDRPSGVVINQATYQAKVIFSSKPILLPQEYFVPLSQIENDDL